MALITWTEEQYGTKWSTADEQHQHLFDLLNTLDDAAKAGDRGAIGSALDALIDFVVKHFQTEEEMMQQQGYPGFAAHKEEHDKLVATCADLQKKFHAGEAEVTPDTTQFVKEWLDHHIPKVDFDYGPYFNERGIN